MHTTLSKLLILASCYSYSYIASKLDRGSRYSDPGKFRYMKSSFVKDWVSPKGMHKPTQ